MNHPPSSRIPRAALIGVTGYGRVHLHELKTLAEAGEVQVAAATVINPDDAPEQMAWLREHDVQIFDDYHSMLQTCRGEIDLCCIPTAIAMHRPMVEAALAAGAHVLVEKPLAGCPEDARAIVEAAERAGRYVCVGFQAVWSPLTRLLLDTIHSGKMGRVRRIAVTGVWPRPHSYFHRNGWAGRIRDAHGIVNDSPANNALAHFLNLALLFAGPAPDRCARVLAVRAERMCAAPIENFDTVLAEITTDTGVEIFYGVTHAAVESSEPCLQILGDKGRALWSMDRGEIQLDGKSMENVPGGHDQDSRPIMFEQTLRASGGGEGLIFPASEAIAHVEAVTAIQAAGETLDYRKQAEKAGDPDNPVYTIPGISDRILERAATFIESDLSLKQT